MKRYIKTDIENTDYSEDIKNYLEYHIKQYFTKNPELELTSTNAPTLSIPSKKFHQYYYAIKVTRNLKNVNESTEYYIEIWVMLFDEDLRDLCDYLDDYMEDFNGYEGSVEPDQLNLITGYMGKIPVYED